MVPVFLAICAIIGIIAYLVSANKKSSAEAKRREDFNRGLSEEERAEVEKILRFTGKTHFLDVTPSEMRNYTINAISKDFHRPRWDIWDDSVHRADGQYDRIERAFHSERGVFKILKYNADTGTATIKGKTGTYSTSPEGCSCKDFAFRNLPCKHMYFLAAETNIDE